MQEPCSNVECIKGQLRLSKRIVYKMNKLWLTDIVTDLLQGKFLSGGNPFCIKQIATSHNHDKDRMVLLFKLYIISCCIVCNYPLSLLHCWHTEVLISSLLFANSDFAVICDVILVFVKVPCFFFFFFLEDYNCWSGLGKLLFFYFIVSQKTDKILEPGAVSLVQTRMILCC